MPLLVHPRTYDIRQELFRLGGRYDRERRGWDIPDYNYPAAQRMLQELVGVKSPPQRQIDLGASLSAVIDLFDVASAGGLKRPRIRLQTPDGRPLVVTLAGKGARFPGSLNVTNGEKYGSNTGVFYGRVFPDGRYDQRVADPAVVAVLARFAKDPDAVAAEYGRSTGTCCYCGKDLSNSEAGSTSVGYGKHCAARWSRPWHPNGKDYVLGIGHKPVGPPVQEVAVGEWAPAPEDFL